MADIIVVKDNIPFGIILIKNKDNVLFITKDGETIKLNNKVFKETYSLASIKKQNIPFWIILLNNYRRLCLKNRDQTYPLILSKLMIKLTIWYLTCVTKDESSVCIICLEEFPKDSKMISFHKEHEKHKCCTKCFSQYKKIKCPVCRGYYIYS